MLKRCLNVKFKTEATLSFGLLLKLEYLISQEMLFSKIHKIYHEYLRHQLDSLTFSYDNNSNY